MSMPLGSAPPAHRHGPAYVRLWDDFLEPRLDQPATWEVGLAADDRLPLATPVTAQAAILQQRKMLSAANGSPRSHGS